MAKEGTEKLLKWEKKDYVLNAVVYAINLIILVAMFLGVVYVRNGFKVQSLIDLFNEKITLLNFAVLLVLCVSIILFYLIFEAKDFLKNASNSQMLFLILEVFIALNFLSERYINIYFRPLAFASLLALFLTDTRKAVFVDFSYCIIYFLFDAFSGLNIYSTGYFSYAAYVMVTQMTSGIIAIYLMRNVYSRFKLFALSIFISIPAVISVVLPFEDFSNASFLKSFLFGVGSGPFSVILCVTLLPLFEFIFKKVTCFKYAELTDHKSKLIRKMIEVAPGTFNHSMLVSSIAESCATAIGEDSLLTRTCAYYHDIGKIRRPEMFKENQGDSSNPNDELAPELSTSIIKAHTNDGYTLLKKNRFPQIIADVSREHHGTMPIIYFYNKAKKFTDGTIDISDYCYDGPKPQTKIAAIIMIADSAEASTRVLKDRSRENVYKTVKKLVDQRLDLGQFDECEITLKELDIITNTVVNCLTGIYHSRVEYPKVSAKELESKFEKDDANG